MYQASTEKELMKLMPQLLSLWLIEHMETARLISTFVVIKFNNSCQIEICAVMMKSICHHHHHHCMRPLTFPFLQSSLDEFCVCTFSWDKAIISIANFFAKKSLPYAFPPHTYQDYEHLMIDLYAFLCCT